MEEREAVIDAEIEADDSSEQEVDETVTTEVIDEGVSARTDGNVQAQHIQLLKDRTKFVTLSFRLLNWKFMNFSMKFPEGTYIFVIKVCLFFELPPSGRNLFSGLEDVTNEAWLLG
jgi:hypothetical protein